jgi:hypothetical protein
LSLEMNMVSGAHAFSTVEGNTDGHDIASVRPTRRGRRTWHVWTLFAWEPGDLTVGQGQCRSQLARIGKARSRRR